MTKLTRADKIIISYLEHDGKIKEKDLAKKCNLSKDSIRYRINRLKKENIITSHSIFLDYTKLGNQSFKLYLKLNGSLKQKQELKHFLATKKEVFAYFESYGSWNLAIVFFAPNLEHYYLLENELLKRFGKLIIDAKLSIMTDAQIFNNKLIYDNMISKNYPIWGEIIKNPIDNKDKIILRELVKNSISTLVALSTKTSLSIDTVRQRIKKLEKRNIIRFYTTGINYQKLDLEIYKLFIYVKNYDSLQEKNLFNHIKSINSSRDLIRTIGPWKIEIEFLIKKHQEFERILKDLQEKFSDIIQDLNFSIIRNETYHPNQQLLL